MAGGQHLGLGAGVAQCDKGHLLELADLDLPCAGRPSARGTDHSDQGPRLQLLNTASQAPDPERGLAVRNTPHRTILGLMARIYDKSLTEGPHVLKDPCRGLLRGRGAAAERGGTGRCMAGAQVFHQTPDTALL